MEERRSRKVGKAQRAGLGAHIDLGLGEPEGPGVVIDLAAEDTARAKGVEAVARDEEVLQRAGAGEKTVEPGTGRYRARNSAWGVRARPTASEVKGPVRRL